MARPLPIRTALVVLSLVAGTAAQAQAQVLAPMAVGTGVSVLGSIGHALGLGRSSPAEASDKRTAKALERIADRQTRHRHSKVLKHVKMLAANSSSY